MRGLDRAALDGVAARALGVQEPGDDFAVTGFQSEQIVGGYGVNLGVHRCIGEARYRGQDASWAAVLAYAASAALRYPLGCLRICLPPLLDESKRRPMEVVHRRPFEEIVDLWGAINRSNIGLADQARVLTKL